MILSFSIQINETKTYFIERIWECLLKEGIFNEYDYERYLYLYNDKFSRDWDANVGLVPKLHTIREDNANRWKAGLIHPVIHNRTPKYFQFADEFPCKSTQTIEIIRISDYLNDTVVKIDGRKLNLEEIQQLAWNDGFNSLLGFWWYFRHGFKGKIIHWTDLKY